MSKRFADIARLCVADMLRVLEAGEGRKIYVDYVAVTQNYLIPFFGKFNIANIGYKQVHAHVMGLISNLHEFLQFLSNIFG